MPPAQRGPGTLHRVIATYQRTYLGSGVVAVACRIKRHRAEAQGDRKTAKPKSLRARQAKRPKSLGARQAKRFGRPIGTVSFITEITCG